MPQRQTANHPQAIVARELLEKLQQYFVSQLSQACSRLNSQFKPFKPIEWLRDEGVHGGGIRYMAQDELFNRASVNFSQVFYEDSLERPLNSATAISTIIHPSHALTPSIHMHISWTHLKTGLGYWRLMADLNPSNPVHRDKQVFEAALRSATGSLYQEGAEQGAQYFYIPALQRHRGISHFYLEQFDSGDWQADFALAQRLGTTVIDTYSDIFLASQLASEPPSPYERQQQLDYHTLYLLQVLTLDRGTTSGLLVHGNNDVGILGSLPRFINRDLLASWVDKVPAPQGALVNGILDALAPNNIVEIDDATKEKLARKVRAFYREYPQAIELQARGSVIPPTTQNHGVK